MVKKKIGIVFFILGLLLISKVGADVSELDKNLVNLGDFEEKDIKKYAAEKWGIQFDKGVILTEETSHSGRQSLKFRVPDGAKRDYFAINIPLCKVEPGKEYKVTFWAKAVDAVGSYTLFPEYAFYKGAREKPKYVGRVFQVIRNPNFDWRKIERIVAIPKDAEWLKFEIGTKARLGSIYIDDISISSMHMLTKESRKERAYIFNKSINSYFSVDEEFESQHIKWSTPYSKGKTKVLFLSRVDRLDDIRKRDVIELKQRLDIDYKFIPLLRKLIGTRSYHVAEELEPYIIDVVQEELKKDYDIVILNKVNFKGIQEELIKDVISELKKGKGLLMVSCTNIPKEIKEMLTKQNQVTLPKDFYNIPEIDKRYKISRQLPLISPIWQVEKGKVSTIDERNSLYPCIPAAQNSNMFPNVYGREIPYWEYKFFPMIKSVLNISGKESDVKINSFAKVDDTTFNLKVDSQTAFSGFLESTYLDGYGHIEKEEKYQLSLKAGDNNVTISIPQLSGGEHLSDYRLLDSKGLIYDFGSYYFETPLKAEIKNVKLKDSAPAYKVGEEIKAEVELKNISSGTKLSWYVEDATYRRILREGSQELSQGQDKVNISFNINRPLGIIYYLFVKVEKDNKLENISMSEFSMPYHYPPPDELLGYGWFAFQGEHGFKRWKESGFDVMTNSTPRYPGLYKNLSTVNLRPGVYGLLSRAGDPDKGSRYRGDQGKEKDDIVRKPCYSDPKWWAEMKESIEKQATQYNPSYYGAKDYSLGDECYLGSNVCVSEWCLKDFRDYLKKEYKNLNELNTSWATSFNSWEEVIPIQRTEVKVDKNNMAAWLDHKIFMTTVFAKLAEKLKTILDGINPEMDMKVGLSGMQNPGYSYNWAELMKYHTSIQHYEGVQKDLIRSFGLPGIRYGMWVGYAGENLDAEKYSRYHIWRGLFNQTNGYMLYYSGYALLGDLSFARNTKYALEELNEIKKGIDKMLLSSELVCDIGLHYSHSSLFAFIATTTKDDWSSAVNSWIRIINDLGLNFKFVSTQQLETDGLNKNQYKAFILPVSVTLSDKEVVALRKYVESGGLLISDYGVGIYDVHGKKRENKQLLQLFGIEREKGSALSPVSSDIKVKGDISAGLENRNLNLKYGEKGLKVTTGKSYGEIDENPAPTIIINRFGSGKAILLNCVMSGYSNITLSGVGGELSVVEKGLLEVNEQVKGFARNLFKIGGISPEVLIRTSTGVDLQSLTKTSIWKNGNIRYVGLLNEPENMNSKILPEEVLDIDIIFENKGYIYDVKEKKYLGSVASGQPIRSKISPAIGNIYSVLPYRVSGIDITSDKRSYKVGEVVVCSVKVRTSGGQAGNHIGYIEVIGPDKEVRNYYTQKVIFKNGVGTIEVPISFNDDIGNWSVNIRDVASGVSKKIDISVTK